MSKKSMLAISNSSIERRAPTVSSSSLIADRHFMMSGLDTDLYLSVQNLGNTQPPLYPTSSTNPGLYYPASSFESALGRYFTIGIKGNL